MNEPITKNQMKQIRQSNHRRFAQKYPSRRERRALAKVSERTLMNMVKDTPVPWYQSVAFVIALVLALGWLSYKLLM